MLIKFRQMLNSQRFDSARISDIQGDKLKKIVSHAYRQVPFYNALFKMNGLVPEDIRGIEDLNKIPVTSKDVMRAVNQADLLSKHVDKKNLMVERSSGSTGTPFDVYYDSSFKSLRNLMFLRGLYAVGYRLGHKLLLLTSHKPKKISHLLLRWNYVSIQDSSEILCREYLRTKPDFVYGCVSALRSLAEQLDGNGSGIRPRGVITTAETLDGFSRRMLSTVFACPVFDFYGLSEMGLVGWECPAHQGYHLSEDMVIVETIPSGREAGRHRLVLTNLESYAMPFLRYDTGDFAEFAEAPSCSCSNRFRSLKHIEGREVDFLLLTDGSRVSPYQLTCEVEKLSGIERYQIIQEKNGELTIRIQANAVATNMIADLVRKTVQPIVGEDMVIGVEKVSRLLPSAPNRKFRVVQCDV